MTIKEEIKRKIEYAIQAYSKEWGINPLQIYVRKMTLSPYGGLSVEVCGGYYSSHTILFWGGDFPKEELIAAAYEVAEEEEILVEA